MNLFTCTFSVTGFTGPILPPISLADTCGNIEKHCPTLPNWVKGAAKLLNTGEEGRDWQALAKDLGKFTIISDVAVCD